jgi:hypothetical protein
VANTLYKWQAVAFAIMALVLLQPETNAASRHRSRHSHRATHRQPPTISKGPCCSSQVEIQMAGLNDVAALSLQQAVNQRFWEVDLHPSCSQFFSPAWQDKIVTALHLVDDDCFFEGDLVDVLCPNFKTFDESVKELFWVWAYASIADVESNCRTHANARGPNGRLDGLMQMESSRRLRDRSGRDKSYCATTREINTYSLDFQFYCTASIIKDLMCDRNLDLNARSNYFQKLRGNQAIAKKIKRFPGCSTEI